MLSFDDLLNALCSQVKPAHANDFQRIYSLETGMEAKLAFEVLIAAGFDAKVYHTPGKPSKLYISNPTQSPEQLQDILSSSLAYAQTLKRIQHGLEPLSKPYSMAFVNAHPTGKQIMIQIAAAQEASAADMSGSLSETAAAVPAPAMATRISAAQPKAVKKIKKLDDSDDLLSGPAVARGLLKASMKSNPSTQKETFTRRLMLRMFGNFAVSGYATLAWLVVAGLLFSCFVASKAYLCYDFVAKKKTAWYCQDPGQVSEEELRRQQQIERQKQLGLQPVNNP